MSHNPQSPVQAELQTLPRRKCFDASLSGFCIGNTFANSLVNADDVATFAGGGTHRFLWVGVGDVRNPLTTLDAIGDVSSKIELHLNDVSAFVLARNAVILAVAVLPTVGRCDDDRDDIATAVWCDTKLGDRAHEGLRAALEELLRERPAWLRISGGSDTILAHWRAWDRALRDPSAAARLESAARDLSSL